MVSTGKHDSYRGPNIKLFIKDVREGKKRPVEVRTWSTIKDVKDTLSLLMDIPVTSIRLYFGPLLTSGRELPNYRTLHDAGIYRSGETLLLDIKSSSDLAFSGTVFSNLRPSNDICISSSMLDSTPKSLRSLVTQTRRGLSLGLKPDLIMEGSGGTYVLRDSRKTKIGIFKPADEEPYAENNPRGYLRQDGQGLSLRAGIVPGEACMREVAAYLLDKDGFSSVPMTTLVEARHPAFNTNGSHLNVSQGGASIGAHSITPNSPVKSALVKKPGSFQEFVRYEDTIDDVSPSMICAEEVHKIAILDIRIMNADRNAANLLVRRKLDNSLELVPIDHGYCLRSVCDVSWMDWCWLDWPQLKEPLSERTKKYVEHLDIDSDARILRERLNLCEEAVDYFRASSSLLKAGVAAGLTLYDIAILCCRNDDLAEEPSMMEKLFGMASELAVVAVENERWHHSAASRALVEQLVPQASPDMTPRRFARSKSSVEMTTLSSRPSDQSFNVEEVLEPEMAQSSGSDSSSDNGDISEDKEDCEEWAAGLIADLSEFKMISMNRSRRSSSVSSDDSSTDGSNDSGSAKGFWVIPPGSCQACVSDDTSIQWSPKTSPRGSVELCSLDIPLLSDKEKENVLKTPTVKFADDYFTPPATVNVGGFEAIESGPNHEVSDIQKSESTGMTRSKSYTALSLTTGRSMGKVSLPSPSIRNSRNKQSEQYEHYRRYFHKFIDLVIVRETTAALHHSKFASANLSK